MKASFNPWPYGVLLFFVLLFCGMAVAVTICLTHRETMVNDNYYEQELKFQQQIDSASRARQCGASVQVPPGAGQVVLAFPAAQVAQKFAGSIQFYRPSAPALDRELPLAPRADGSQSLDVSQFATGLWQVRVKWNAGGQDYFLEQKITL
jgi:hypothetical protein